MFLASGVDANVPTGATELSVRLLGGIVPGRANPDRVGAGIVGLLRNPLNVVNPESVTENAKCVLALKYSKLYFNYFSFEFALAIYDF